MILNTQQIILLCLLVSFVTSIATGIVTVSLMQQDAEPVTQTINRVIERTVEVVTSQEPLEQIKGIVTQNQNPDKEVVTVVVNQEDQTINAVTKNEASVVRLYTNSKAVDFVTMGIILNQAGDILVDKRMVNKILSYTAKYGEKTFVVKYKSGTETSDFVVLQILGESPDNFVPATFGESSSLKLAQSVISLSGSRDTSVSTASITSLPSVNGSVATIKTSVDPANVLTGSVLLNLQGLIVGIKLATAEDRTTFMPSSLLTAQISSL